MGKAKNNGNNKKGPDLNGNSSKPRKVAVKKSNGMSALIINQVTGADGQVFYPCRFCNKVFPVKTSRTVHIRKCPAKDYILSVGNTVDPPKKQRNIPKQKPDLKIDIKQHIVLKEQLNVDGVLAHSSSPPIKLTIRRSPSSGSDSSNQFTVSNSLVLKEKNEANDEFSSIAKRLENNSVTIIKQPKQEDDKNIEDDSLETTCRECSQEFESQLELLRHSRKCHSYPKVLMALSEVKKFYSVKDRSECPICHKPLKNVFRSAFVKHLHTHTNEMKYDCKVCNKKFRRSDHMKAHEKRHIMMKEGK